MSFEEFKSDYVLSHINVYKEEFYRFEIYFYKIGLNLDKIDIIYDQNNKSYNVIENKRLFVDELKKFNSYILFEFKKIIKDADQLIINFQNIINKIKISDLNKYKIIDDSDDTINEFVFDMEQRVTVKLSGEIEEGLQSDFDYWIMINQIINNIEVRFIKIDEFTLDFYNLVLNKILNTHKLRLKYLLKGELKNGDGGIQKTF